jgi:hypothetical protein
VASATAAAYEEAIADYRHETGHDGAPVAEDRRGNDKDEHSADR